MKIEPLEEPCPKCGGPMELLIFYRLDNKTNRIPRCKYCIHQGPLEVK